MQIKIIKLLCRLFVAISEMVFQTTNCPNTKKASLIKFKLKKISELKGNSPDNKNNFA